MGGMGMGGMGMGMGGMGGQQMGMRPGGARPGMMPGMMPGMQGGMMRQPMMGAQPRPGADMTASNLANAPPGMQKQMLGEKIFPLIARMQPEMAGKITGMMLEMDNSELLILLESPDQLKMKVDEALRVLEGSG